MYGWLQHYGRWFKRTLRVVALHRAAPPLTLCHASVCPKEKAMKAEAMSLRKSRCAPVLPVCHDAEIMAPLKHDCLFPLTTPTCQWVGHAAPETAPRLQPLACVHEYAQGLPKLGHHRGRMQLQTHSVCVYMIVTTIDLLNIKGSNRILFRDLSKGMWKCRSPKIWKSFVPRDGWLASGIDEQMKPSRSKVLIERRHYECKGTTPGEKLPYKILCSMF